MSAPVIKAREQRHITQGKEPLADLKPMSELYRVSTRRLYDYLTKKHKGFRATVLGVTHVGCGRVVTFDGREITEMTEALGPISDIPERYLVPGGVTSGVNIEFMSGLVSGKIYQGKFFAYKNKPSQVELWAESGCSGVIVRLAPSPSKF